VAQISIGPTYSPRKKLESNAFSNTCQEIDSVVEVVVDEYRD
jgi:hypothetical protein